MKLKRLFLDSIFLLSFVMIISCSSTKFSVPIPGQNEAVITNIYIEYLNIADIYFGLEKFDKAETYYKAAMGNKDIYWSAYYKLAKCYVYQSKWGDAQSTYETILKRDPDNSSIKSSMAYIYAMSGNTQKSIEIYKELIEAEPDQQELLENYICVLLTDENNKEEAQEAYETLKERFPESKKIEEFDKQFPKPEPEENLETESDSESEEQSESETQEKSETSN